VTGGGKGRKERSRLTGEKADRRASLLPGAVREKGRKRLAGGLDDDEGQFVFSLRF
jgi:hypothetical protein